MPIANRWTVLAVLAAALALVSLDNTIVNVALPSIQEDLGATTSQLQWVVDAYSVLFAGFLLPAGALGDRFGRRRMLVIGIVIFLVGSTLAGFAPDASSLTLCRGLMGIGGAFIMPSTLSILVQVFSDPHERAQAIGTWAAVAGIGVAIGPILGGFLLEHFTWHAVFWVNPPLAVLVLVAVLRIVPESADPSRPRLDVLGGALSALGLIALVVSIIEFPESGFGVVPITSAVLAIALLGSFVWWEGRAPRPMLPMSFFQSSLFSGSVVIVGLVYFALMAAMFFLPQFLQLVQGRTPLQSGLVVLPGALGLLVASLVSPRVADRLGTRRLVMVGLSIVVVGLASFSTLRADTSVVVASATFAFVGIGLGLTLPQATNGVLASVPRERAGVGSAVNDAMGELGGSLGVAILGAVMAVTYRAGIAEAIVAAGPSIDLIPVPAREAAKESLAAATLASAQLSGDVAEAYRAVAGAAFVDGMGWALFTGAGLVLLGVVLAWRALPARVETVAE